MASAPGPTCNSLYCSTNCCKYTITNTGVSSEIYSYTSCVDNSYITNTLLSGQTINICSVGMPDVSPSITYQLLGCCDSIYTFQECDNSSNKFIFTGLTSTLNVGDVFYVTSTNFIGYASVISFESTSNIYDGSSAIFTQQIKCPAYSGITTGTTGWSYYNYCGDLMIGLQSGQSVCVDTSKEYSGINVSSTICYDVCKKAALLQRCNDSSIFYALVDEDTAFIGAVYIYNGNCYSFIEFSGPGGPYLGEPDYAECSFCSPSPTTPILTPSVTPSITPTIPVCEQTEYCFRTNLNNLTEYSGTYFSAGTYNGRVYYSGNGITNGYIYFNNSEWCLSNNLGDPCLLKGSFPCVSECPDFNNNFFYIGNCPTPTPTPTSYNTVDFQAIFECDFGPTPSATPALSPSVTPSITPTITPTSSPIVGVEYTVYSEGQTIPISSTPIPTITLTKTVAFSGSVNFILFEQNFIPVASMVMRDCLTNEYYYIAQNINYNLSGITIGNIIKANINGNIYCLEYITNDTNISPNTYISEVYDIYYDCSNCQVTPTPTPSITNTMTPSVTMTITPTPSVSSNMIYVFKSCNILPEQTGIIYLTQTEPYMISLTTSNVVKDIDDNCWEYLGIYPSSYISPFGSTQINFFGNYFNGTIANIFLNCNNC